jgi:peptidoglycan/LPS O-acetylase OafA/YrhL
MIRGFNAVFVDNTMDEDALVKTQNSVYLRHLQGLRAIAVVLVILFHTSTPGFVGGGIGVDMFFAISGYIITTSIEKGTTTLSCFYIKRICRLVPAASLVIIITILWAYRVETSFNVTAATAQYATLSAANIYFIKEYIESPKQQNGYWSQISNAAPQNPLLHYWSLGVEEQFYLFYAPLLFLCLPRMKRGTIVIMLSLLALASIIVAEVVEKPVAFYSLPTRLWQLLAGCLFSLEGHALYERLITNEHTRTILSCAGLCGLIIVPACVLQIHYPGGLSLVPIIGTLLAIATPPNTILDYILSRIELTTIGDASYTIYLMHWPFIVLGGVPFVASVLDKWLYVLAAITVAFIVYLRVETPLRKHRWGIIVACVFIFVAFLLSTFLQQPPSSVGCEFTIPQSRNVLEGALQSSRYITTIPQRVLDIYRMAEYGYEDVTLNTTQTNVLVLGDSHMRTLMPALNYVARARNWRVYLFSFDACSLPILASVITDIPLTLPGRSVDKFVELSLPTCLAMYEDLLHRFLTDEIPRPDVILVGGFKRYALQETPRYTELEWGGAFNIVYTHFRPRHMIMFGDPPTWNFNAAQCLADKRDASNCQLSTATARAYQQPTVDIELQAAALINATYFDLFFLFCTNCTCLSVIGNTITMQDDNHISAIMSRQLGPIMHETLPII